MAQLLIPTGELSGLLMRIAMTESVSIAAPTIGVVPHDGTLPIITRL
jgi:hypothetical protein